MLLHLHAWGPEDAPPLACLHGVTGHGERFRALAERLPRRRVLAPDLRGHGRSGEEPPWDAGTHAADVLETLAAAGVTRCDWVGFSFGGLVLAELAARAPAAVARACLLDPAIALPAQTCREQARDELREQRFRDPEEAIAARLAGGTLFSTPRELLEEEMRQHLVRGADGLLRPRYSRLAAIGAWSEMARAAPPVARVPTLLVRGARSWVPVDRERLRAALGELLRDEELDSGHTLLWDALDQTASLVAGFLDS